MVFHLKHPMNTKQLLIALLALGASSIQAQTVSVPFSTNAAGKKTPIEWGMDAAWDWDYNVMRGIAHYGKNFTTGRISFQPYNLVDASKLNDASANFGLSAGQVRKLQWRIDLIKRTGATRVNINCDHEVLVRAMDDEGNYGKDSKVGEVNDNVGKGNYVGTSRTDLYRTTEWVNLIKASVKYAQAQGLEVISVSPFNESDYGWNQYYNGGNGASETNQSTYGIPAFKAIAKAIKEDSFFNGIRVCGGNTLNCDRAAVWYNGLKEYLDEGNTHQLAGSFDNYANFFKLVKDDGKVPTADEVHNVGEAMVGVEYGMQNAIWWGFDSKARGQFMHDSNEGVRLGYAEDRSHWTSAAVYRNDKDGEIHGFIGSSERQANVSIYNFQCQDREVYFNGYGPQKEWSVTTVGGTSYQNGQINYERLFDITYGEDVQSFPVDGNYQLMSAADMKLVTSNGAWNGGNHLSAAAQANNNSQRWHIYPGRTDGDCSYWFIDNVGDDTQHWNLLDGGGAAAMSAGSRVICYNAGHDALEQWYLRYAKDGYFYIMARQNNKYLYNNNGTLSLQDAPTKSTGAKELKKYMWRLMPTDATAEQTAPSTPTGLAEGAVTSASASFSWTAVTGESKAVTYNVLRQDANGWNTIARVQSGTTYTDTKVEAGKGYRYKVQAVDYSGNRSEASATISIFIPEEGGDTPTFTAGQWEWVGETAAAGDWYLFNSDWGFLHADASNSYPNKDVSDATLFTITAAGSTATKLAYQVSNTTYYLNNNNGSMQINTTGSNLYARIGNATNGYYITTYSASTLNTNNYGNNRYLNVWDGGSGWSRGNGGNKTQWKFLSTTQMSKYAKVLEYTNAFDAAKAYLSADLSSELMTELTTTLDACDGTINYTNIETYITNLTNVAEKCRQYVQEHPAQPGEERTDFTGLIINPTVIQNGTTNDMPTGWVAAKTNVTGNGHCTEGTGDTRLEAWHWTGDLNAEYYQDVIVPNGLYTLTAVTHQRENGNAALYGETYKSFETKMPVGDGNEAQTDVTKILVTDGILRIGMKVSGSGNWATADNFTLTRVSTPENTALSHYTDAIAYLDEVAEAELVRNVDHTELLAARKAARYCEVDANAYEKAINDYVAAIKRAKALTAAEPVLSGSWIGQTGNYAGDFAERYNWDTPYSAGRILYQVVEDLIPGGEYEIQFYAVANVARNLANSYAGNGIAYIFANDTEEDINVIYQDGCTPTDYPRTLRAVADENGQIAYGIANRKDGGQWYVAKSKSITYLGTPYTATLSVKPEKYGTFIAPFDVELPENVTAYSAELRGTSVSLTEIGSTVLAYTPVIVKNDNKTQVTEDYSRDNVTLTQAKAVVGPLVGVLISGDYVPPTNGYVLQTQNGVQAFYRVSQEEAKAIVCVPNRCYIISKSSNESPVKAFLFGEDEDLTSIENLLQEGTTPTSAVVYDLSGRRIDRSRLQKGVYIINGRKVLVK